MIDRCLALAGLFLLALVAAPSSAHAQAMCGVPGADGSGTVSGVVNTYYAGTGTLAAGATQLTLGARNTGSAAANVAAGDLLLVIQMQDGEINTANNANYGSGTGVGSGTTSMGNAGRHEFVRALSGGNTGSTISFQPALTHAYVQAAATSSRGQRSYQVIRVPQYSAVTLAGVTGAPWNGASGGVVAIDDSQTLTLGSGTVEGIANRAIFLAGRGFRGAAGVSGSANSNDLAWRYSSASIAHGGKGEGIAGTPRYMARKTNNYGQAVTTTGHLVRVDTGVQGYPQGDRARGAPGNAGGGGTDGTYSPATGTNNRNAGGGGGGNHAPGGLGGRPWDSPLNDTNGRGGAGYASQISFSRVIMGGGGGSGGTNDGTDDQAWYENLGIACGIASGAGGSGTPFGNGICSSGGSGGGIVILRARAIQGSGVIDVRGAPGYNVRNDAAGGGGAGGSVVLYTSEGGQAQIDARGGDGGNAWAGNSNGLAERHGPGGGGGGGFVVFSPQTMAVTALVDGGAPGRSSNGPTDTYGSFGHNGGVATFQAPDTPGVIPGAQCEPDLVLVKDNGSDVLLTSGTTTYTLTVLNQAAVPTSGLVTVVDVLPPQLAVADGPVPTGGPQGGDWTCSAASNVLTCTSPAVIAGGGVSVFSFTASVDAPSGSAIINRARVGGGGDPHKPVPTPGNTASCVDNDVAPGCAIDIDLVEAPFLSLAKANAGTLLAGGSGNYLLTVHNNGSAPTSGTIRVVDVLPAGVSFASGFSTTGGFTCSHSAGVIECNSSSVLAVGASASIGFEVLVAGDAPTSVTNRAVVGGGGDPVKPDLPTPGDAQACAAPLPPATAAASALSGCASVTDPVRRVQLTLEKTDYQNSMPINGQTTYHFIVRNSGDADSVGTIWFRDELPAPMTWSSPLGFGGDDAADWSCTREDNNSAICQTSAVIPVGGSSTFFLVANVNGATAGVQYVNKARIAGGGDPALLPGAPTPAQVGTGCTGINVGPGCALDINVPVAQPQLRLVKTHPDPQPRNPGDTFPFNLVVSNSGGNASSGQIRVVDVIPAGLTYVGSTTFSSGGFSCTFSPTPAPGYLTCTRSASLAVGASATISYTAQVAAGASNPVINRAQVGGGNDPGLSPASSVTATSANECSGDMTPNPGCAIDPVPLNADLQISKSQRPGSSGSFQATPLTLFHGDAVQFSIVISNNGPSTVNGATFSDVIPAQFQSPTLVSATGSSSPACTLGSHGLSGNTLTGTVTSIAPGGSCTLIIQATAGSLGTGIENTATVAVPPGVHDTEPGNNSSSTSTDIIAMAPGLDISKSSPDSLLLRGGTVTYSVTVANSGNIPLSDVAVSDPVPTGLTAFTWTCTASGGATCPAASGSGALSQTIPSLPVGGQLLWAISAQVEAGAPDPVVNTATASANEICLTPCAAQVSLPVAALPAVAKQFDPASIAVGGSSTLTLTLANPNDVAAVLVADLVDALPAGVTLTGAPVTTCAGTVSGALGGSSIVLEAGAVIPAGAPGTCTISAPVTSSTPGTVTNTIPAGGLETDLGNNPDPAEADLLVTGDAPTVAKTFVPDTIANGGIADLTISLGNSNAVPATLIADLVDTLPAGVTLASAPVTTCSGTASGNLGGNTITLASGSEIPPGGCTITAQVTSTTPGTVTNIIPAGGLETDLGDNPDPAEDDLTVLPVPQVTLNKSADPAAGSPVVPGQTIQYTLAVTVADAPLSADLAFSDTLGPGLGFAGLVSAVGFNCSGALDCILPAGSPVGSYTVVYTANVDSSAHGSVGNQVVITANGGDPDPACTVCSTEHPVLAPEVTVAKSANPANGTEVTAGQTLTYTLSVTVADAATTSDVVLTDVLGSGLTFAGVTSAGDFSIDASGAPTLVFTLPAGSTPGTYEVAYTATVDNDATASVGNSVSAIGGGGPGDPDPVCTTCATEHPVSAPEVTVAKSANPASGTEVTAGQTLTYTLSVTVADAATLSDVVLTDVLGSGLTFGAVTAPGDFGVDASGAPTLVFILPAGSTPGSYELSYTATVDNDATVSVGNSVSAIGGGGPGDPDPSCTTCSTDHPVSAPEVTVTKAANPASGTEVTAGQTLTYTLSVTVADAATTSDVVLTDVLGSGLTFAGVTSAGDFSIDASGAPTLVFTLPAGSTPGTYEVSYTATVDNDATVSVGNSVSAVGGGGPGDPDPSCTTCSTDHPVSAPEVTVTKAANPASGTEVTAGQTLTYTLSVTVADAATLSDVVLTDVLGSGLTFGAVTSAGDFGVDASAAPTLVFTLPAGSTPGSYEVSYTATVDNDATVSVGNTVTATGGGDPGDPGAPDPVCDGDCATEHPITAPEVAFSKAADPASGTAVAAGDTLTYTLTVQVEHSATLSDVVLTDVLGSGLTFGAVTSAGDFGVDASAAPTLVFTLPAGSTPGSYEVSYTATVDNDATVSVSNTVTATGGGDPGDPGAPDPVCDGDCATEHPLSPAVRVAKALTGEDGSISGVAEPGEMLEYTITLTNTGGLDAVGFQVSDLLDEHTIYQSASHGGSHDGSAQGGLVEWAVTVPAHDGTDPGTVELTVTVQVVDEIPQDVTTIVNLAYESGTPPPVCPPAGPACVVTPTAPDLVVTKTVSAHSIDDDGVAEPGEELTYTITVVNHGGVAALDTIINEVVPEHTTFVGGAPLWTCAPGDPAGTACDNLVDVPASAGAGSPGQLTLTFVVRVDDPLAAGVQAIRNAVAVNDGTPPDCELDAGNPACAVTPTINIDLRKAVTAIEPTGPASWRVSYQIDVVNLGGAPAQYTLVDTLGYPAGVVFTGSGQVATVGGVLDPALVGGQFTPANNTPLQLSDDLVLLQAGEIHAYMVTVPIGIQPGLLVDGQCQDPPDAGHGLYNLATVSGSFDLEAPACADVAADVPLIRLVKTVELGVDHNGNAYGDVGDVLHYQFVISNPGTVPLTAVQLVDPRVSDLQCSRATAHGQPFYVFRGDEVFDDAFEGTARGGILDPGDSVSCTATHVLSQADVDRGRVVNTATAIGSTAAGQAVSSVSTAIYTALR